MKSVLFALRSLFRSPFVTIVAIVSLGLGIGANAAIFTMFDQMLLRPLPVQDPGRLVNLAAPGPKPGSQSSNNAGRAESVFSYPMFRDLEQAQTVFTGMAAHRTFGANLSYRKQTTSGDGMFVSGGYFQVLGLQPVLGRLIGPADDTAPGESPVVVLGHAYWRTRFDASPSVINDTIIVNGQAMTIVGVAPPGFDGTTLGSKPQVYAPITMRGLLGGSSPPFTDRRDYWVYVFARLKPGMSLEQASAGINVPYRAIINDVEAPLQQGMSEQTLKQFRAKEIALEDGRRGQSSIHREAKAPLILLLSVTGFVLLIACANIANLLLARGAARAPEMAIRLSIGASRWQLVRQLLVESCLLAFLGGLAGLLFSGWTLNGVLAMMPANVARTIQPGIDARVLLFAAALVLGTGLLFGLFPAIHSTRPDLVTALKGQSGQPGGSRSASRFRSSLATLQIALSMTLLVSSGLFIRSLINVSRVNLGLDTDHVVTFGLSPRLNAYPPDRSRALFERLEEELAAVPGVQGVTSSTVPLLAGNNWGKMVDVEGFTRGPDTDARASYNELGLGYFRTLGSRMLAGREFTVADTAGAPNVAIVNEAFAKKFGLGRDAVGKRMFPGRPGKRELDTEIVGLVQDTAYSEVKAPVPPTCYTPYRQSAIQGFMTFYVRTALDPEQFLTTIPKVVAALDPDLPVDNLRTLSQQVQENVFADRVVTVLATGFAVLATLLAAIGLYGVLAYTVAQRTREIGVRMAVGAAPGRVRAMILTQVAVMAAVGGGIGLAAAVALGRAARSMLFGLEGHDPAVLGGAIAALGLVALGAGLIPAHRAARVDPIRALRYD